jgi:hypothetical protein
MWLEVSALSEEIATNDVLLRLFTITTSEDMWLVSFAIGTRRACEYMNVCLYVCVHIIQSMYTFGMICPFL